MYKDRNSNQANSDGAAPAPTAQPDPEPDPAPPEQAAPQPAEDPTAAPTAEPGVAAGPTAAELAEAERTGVCPTSTVQQYAGPTTDFAIRVCEGPADAFTYVGGNDDLGYVALELRAISGASGLAFTGTNEGTRYDLTADGLAVTPNSGDPWTQVWRSGAMDQLAAAG